MFYSMDGNILILRSSSYNQSLIESSSNQPWTKMGPKFKVHQQAAAQVTGDRCFDEQSAWPREVTEDPRHPDPAGPYFLE
jgi:hypothetical protein